MVTECWKWPESKWVSPEIDWKKAAVISAGVDVGSISSQSAIMSDGKIYAYSNIRTVSDSRESARKAMDAALEGTGMRMEDIRYTVSTGYGRFNAPFADSRINEVTCHARGARYIYGDTIRTVVDMGGQDCKVIKCDGGDKVINFMMNDKCATGAGRGIEVFADMVSVPVQEIGKLSLDVDEDPEPVSSTCSIFGNSEAMNLMRTGLSKNKVLAAYCYGMAHRIYTLVMRIEPENDMAITGGIAKNPGIANRVKQFTGLSVPEAKYDPQIAGAVGAAIYATEQVSAGK